MNVLVGVFVFWTASVPHWIHKDSITVLVIDNEEVTHASVVWCNELPRLVQVHSACDWGAASISVLSA